MALYKSITDFYMNPFLEETSDTRCCECNENMISLYHMTNPEYRRRLRRDSPWEWIPRDYHATLCKMCSIKLIVANGKKYLVKRKKVSELKVGDRIVRDWFDDVEIHTITNIKIAPGKRVYLEINFIVTTRHHETIDTKYETIDTKLSGRYILHKQENMGGVLMAESD